MPKDKQIQAMNARRFEQDEAALFSTFKNITTDQLIQMRTSLLKSDQAEFILAAFSIGYIIRDRIRNNEYEGAPKWKNK